MIQVNIKKNGTITHSPIYDTIEQAQVEIARHSSEGNWGKPEHQEEVLDDNGISFDPPQFITVPSEFTVEIVDISTQVAQEQINAQALAYLTSTDWLIIREIDEGTPCPAGIKAERAAARARIVR